MFSTRHCESKAGILSHIPDSWRVKSTYPSADCAIPTDDGAHDPRVVSDVGVVHDDASLQTHTGSDLGARSDNNVRADQGSSESQAGGSSLDRHSHIFLAPTGRSQPSTDDKTCQQEDDQGQHYRHTGSTNTLPP